MFKPGEECEIRSAALTTIFTALAAQPVPLQDLVIHRESKTCHKPTSEEAGVWALSIPKPLLAQLSPSLSTIKSLHLSLSTAVPRQSSSAASPRKPSPKATALKRCSPSSPRCPG